MRVPEISGTWARFRRSQRYRRRAPRKDSTTVRREQSSGAPATDVGWPPQPGNCRVCVPSTTKRRAARGHGAWGKLVDRCSPICPSIADQADRSQNGGAMAAASTAVETTLGQGQARRPPARLEPAETLQRPGLRFVSRRRATGPPRRARSPPPGPRTRPNRPRAGRIARDRFRRRPRRGRRRWSSGRRLLLDLQFRRRFGRRHNAVRIGQDALGRPSHLRLSIAAIGRRLPGSGLSRSGWILGRLVCHGSGLSHLRAPWTTLCGTPAIAPPDVCGADDSTAGWPAATDC